MSTGNTPNGLEDYGIRNANKVYWNLPTSVLYEEILRRREAVTASLGALVVRTGRHTGRSPDDKFAVHEATSKDQIGWGTLNRPIEVDKFHSLYSRLLGYLEDRDLFV